MRTHTEHATQHRWLVASYIAIAITLGGILLAARAHATNTAAKASKALVATDTADLHYVREGANSTLIDEGTATGTLRGKVKVQFSVGAAVKATFTITTRNGSITGQGAGALHSSGEYASFGGTMTVAHGTGRYAHAHGHGGFYGVINRNTYAVTLQTTGTLTD